MSKKKATIKSIIVGGILEGWGANRILKAVVKKHPDSQADLTHVKYYSGGLKRAGEITQAQHDKYLSKPRKSDDKPVKKSTKKTTPTKVTTKASTKTVKKVSKLPKTVAKIKKVAKVSALPKTAKKVSKVKEIKKVPRKVKKPKAA